jgi:hypothetical protein
MRDNHTGMPELLEVFEKSAHYFARIEIVRGDQTKRFQFGVSRVGYLALKRTLQERPFDRMPGLKYRYFYISSQRPYLADEYVMFVRVELGRDATKVEITIPKDLHSNLLWFSRLLSLDDAAYLEVPI